MGPWPILSGIGFWQHIASTITGKPDPPRPALSCPIRPAGPRTRGHVLQGGQYTKPRIRDAKGRGHRSRHGVGSIVLSCIVRLRSAGVARETGSSISGSLKISGNQRCATSTQRCESIGRSPASSEMAGLTEMAHHDRGQCGFLSRRRRKVEGWTGPPRGSRTRQKGGVLCAVTVGRDPRIGAPVLPHPPRRRQHSRPLAIRASVGRTCSGSAPPDLEWLFFPNVSIHRRRAAASTRVLKG